MPLESSHREQEKYLRKLAFLKVVGQVLHGIGAHAAHIAVLAGVLQTQGGCARGGASTQLFALFVCTSIKKEAKLQVLQAQKSVQAN
jgi:hypothetical protein